MELPDDYKIHLEPIGSYHTQNGNGGFSGNYYVVVLLKGEHLTGIVKIRSPRNCDHTATICTGNHSDGRPCVESWQYDYSILWSRTGGGRKMIADLSVAADKYQNPAHPANNKDFL